MILTDNGLQTEQVAQLQAFIQAYLSMSEQHVEALREAQEALQEVYVRWVAPCTCS
jgi:flagellar biosynthesis chaperone FliJ